MSRYRRLIGYAFRQWHMLIPVMLLTFVSSVLAALQPLPLKLLVDNAAGDELPPQWLRSVIDTFSAEQLPVVLVAVAAAATLAVFVLSSAVDLASGWTSAVFSQRIIYDLASDLFKRLQRLSLAFHSRRSVGDSLTRLTVDTSSVFAVVEGLLTSSVRQLFTLATVGFVAFRLDPLLATTLLVVAPVLGGSSRLFGHRLKDRRHQFLRARSGLLAFVQQTLPAIPLVQSFCSEDRNRSQFRRLAEESVVAAQKGVTVRGGLMMVNTSATTITTALVIFVGAQRVLDGALSAGALIVFISYSRTVQAGAEKLVNTYADLKFAAASVDRVFEVMDADEEIAEVPGAPPLVVDRQGQGARVTFDDVVFGYEAGRPVLRGVSLDVEPGETVAIVGATGAGKTTLVSLVPRFFDPWEGRVLVDGVDVRSVQVASLRAQVSLVLQEPFLLPLSVAENLAYGRPGASRDEVVAAATAANADDFISRLPLGYDTPLGERAVTLSGGERQRLAIARALVKDAPVLILDEPTSALDAHTEHSLVEALERLSEGRTTLIIAHRLSTIRRADRVMVMEGGRIVEVGTHRELLEAGGSYARLHEAQFGSRSVFSGRTRDASGGVVA